MNGGSLKAVHGAVGGQVLGQTVIIIHGASNTQLTSTFFIADSLSRLFYCLNFFFFFSLNLDVSIRGA